MRKKSILSLVALALLLLVAIESNAQRKNRAPENRFGIRAGFNMSDLTSAKGLDVYNGLSYYNQNFNYVGFTDTEPFKLGFNVGFVGQIKLADYWYLQPSLIFTSKGYKLNTQNQGDFTQNVELDVEAYYVQLPIDILWKYNFSTDFRFFAQGGAFLGYGVAGTSYFIDHFGEKFVPRVRHEQTAMPTAVNGYIGYDHTVHGLMDEDYDEIFMTEGTNRFELGVELGLGFEYKAFQLTLSYQYGLTPLYDYDYDFSGRYEAKGIQNISNSFEYLKIPTPKSPVQHVISFTLAYYMNLFSNKVKY